VDFNSCNFFDRNPDGKSPIDEMEQVDRKLKRWYDCFPQVHLCLGNHDLLVSRRAFKFGLPSRVIRSFPDIWDFPVGWQANNSWEFDGVRYMHGTGLSGRNAHIKAAELNRQSTVIGHSHSSGGQISYLVSENDRIFGMNCGTGLDRKLYAFAYQLDVIRKPVLGCSIVSDRGKYCQFFPMDL
jgi:hypothetical protein